MEKQALSYFRNAATNKKKKKRKLATFHEFTKTRGKHSPSCKFYKSSVCYARMTTAATVARYDTWDVSEALLTHVENVFCHRRTRVISNITLAVSHSLIKNANTTGNKKKPLLPRCWTKCQFLLSHINATILLGLSSCHFTRMGCQSILKHPT